MCDYSAEAVMRRKAAVGDKLAVGRLNQHAVGLVSPSENNLAVCLIPGTTLICSGVSPADQEKFGVGEVATAIFHQRVLKADEIGSRDCIVFQDQVTQYSFAELPLGLEVSVELIPGEASPFDVEPELDIPPVPQRVNA